LLFLLGDFQTMPGMLLLHSEIVKEFLVKTLSIAPTRLGSGRRAPRETMSVRYSTFTL